MTERKFRTRDVIEACQHGASKTLLFEDEIGGGSLLVPKAVIYIVQAKDNALYYAAPHAQVTGPRPLPENIFLERVQQNEEGEWIQV